MPAVRTLFAAPAALALAAGLLLVPSTPAQANTNGTALVISEVYGAGGNSGAMYNADYVELYNPTDAPVPLSGYYLQYRSGTGTGNANGVATLSGTVPPESYFLVATSPTDDPDGAPLPADPDITVTGVGMAAASGTIYLATTATALNLARPFTGHAQVVDLVGFGSTNTFEGAGPTTAISTTLAASRNATAADTDVNSADFVVGAPSPQNAGTGEPEALAAADPADRSVRAGLPITPIDLVATGGTPPYSWSVEGLPADLELNDAQITGTPAAPGPSTVTVTVTDSADPVATASQTFVLTVTPALSVTPIHEVQGTGATTPVPNQDVLVEGVVTASYPTGGFNGFYVQTAGTGGTEDTTPGASDAIFVWGGSAGFATYPAVGDSIQVAGRAVEGAGPATGLTQITNGAWSELDTPLAAVTPLEVGYPTTDAEREAHEGMLVKPTGDFTVSNAYNINSFAEIGLAAGDEPLRQPSEFASPTDMPAINAIKAQNAERSVALDDGSSVNYMTNSTAKNQPLPWLTPANPIRVGAAVTFDASGVIFEYRNNVWKYQPRAQLTGDGADVATFENTRLDNAAPQDVGGDLTIATFNVLNYFNTTGEAYMAETDPSYPQADTNCTFYKDRAGANIGNDSCGLKGPGVVVPPGEDNDGRGPRGAATDASLARQEEKLVHTINLMDADVIGLEEIENSIKLPNESNRDDAVSDLVAQLNDAAGTTKWGYVVSPPEAVTSAAVAEQDVIRPAFIYQVATVEPVGQSEILFGTTEFANAREPLAQVFKAKGAPDGDGFAMIVNHFKSKGDNPSWATPATGDNANDAETGVGAFNGDRTRQAERLVEFAEDFAADRGVEPVFLAGDFNSYSKEQPVAVIEGAGYTQVESDTEGEETYSYNGLYGSLDHIFANAAADLMVEGADIWNINSVESVAFQYSRFNYNATDFWQPNQPFGTSDHDPEIVGINVAGNVETPPAKQIQIVGTNDFHGRLLPDGGNAAGAAALAGKVDQLRAQNPNTVFVAAGDLVGGSTFESFIQDDNPTIDALNEAGLEVSAAGNHEFDRGYDDFVGRIQDRAAWEYIAANIDVEDGMEDLSEVWTKTIDGVNVGFVGAVTEDLPNLVGGNMLDGVTVTDVVDSVNEAAEGLKTNGADVVVLLVHEGAPTTRCDTDGFTNPATVFGNIVQNTSPDVDAIISGHTHLAYNCRFPVEEWSDRDVKQRPVVSAGQYGTNLNQLVLSFDAEDNLTKIDQSVLAAAGVGAPENAAVAGIVEDAVEFADEAGSAVLGKVGGPFRRATYTSQSTSVENRGGESTLNNLVAEVQRWATEDSNDADIAFMNPGGLRADMAGEANGNLTYRQAADVQPFANTLVNMRLTGAQIKKVLEQQWQRTATGHVPSRPFLRLGVSDGFTYTYTTTPERVTAPNSAPVDTFKGTVTGMWLDGEPIEPTATYSVTANSFLAGGGDNFWELANGTQKVDTGKGDLEAMVDFMEQYESTPLAVDFAQRAVQVKFPNSAPASYEPGGTVAFDVSSWSMSGAGDAKDTQLQVKLGDTVLKSDVAVTTTASTTPYDESGTAAVSVTLPAGVAEGNRQLTLVGATTGTEVTVPIVVNDGTTDVQILATNDFHGRLHNNASGTEAGAAVLSGAVKQLRAANPNTVFAAAGDLIGASTFDSFILQDKPTIDALNEAGLEVSAVGNHELDKGYSDLVDRVMAAESAENPRGGAEWEYIAANLTEPEGADNIEASWIKEFGEIKVGFVGAVTEDLMTLIQADGNEGVDVTDIVTAVNDEAEELKTAGADIVVMLVHEGAPSTSCDLQSGSVWNDVVTGVGADVDAIVSGHTHFGYNCQYPVPAWADDPTRAVKNRPVVSAGQYGSALNQLVFTVDDETGRVVAKSQALLNLKTGQTANYPVDAPTKTIVDQAAADAEVPGSVELGEIGDPFLRAKFADGATENRGGESTLNNLVAEVQRWATPESVGGADIAFMNAGGLRDDMVGLGTGEFPRELTYRQAANVQSFANTLVNMDLTGAQIKTLLEQQWQRAIAGDGTVSVPARSFIKLGVSDGFTYTYDQAADPAFPGQKKGTVTGMWLDDEPIDLEATYSVTVNSFLSTGGDNFHVLKDGTDKQDTGKVDLESMVDYMAAEGGAEGESVDADYGQRAVGVHFADGAPEAYAPGAQVAFDLYSLSMSGSLNSQTLKDITDDEVEVRLGDEPLGTFDVTTTLTSSGSSSAGLNDDAGTANVEVTLPAGLAAGVTELTVVGLDTGTVVRVPIEIAGTTSVDAGDDVTVAWGQPATIEVEVSTNGADPTGLVRLYQGETVIGEPVAVEEGVATLTVPAKALEPGDHTLRAVYGDDEAEDELILTVTKAELTVTADDVTAEAGQAIPVAVEASDATATGDVTVSLGETELDSGELSDGSASLTVPAGALEPGTHTLTLEYGGDAHFQAADSTFTATVTVVTVDAGADMSVTWGQVATIEVGVTSTGEAPTGDVQLYKGETAVGEPAAVEEGVATLTVPAKSLEPGAHTLRAVYGEDEAEDELVLTVEKATLTVGAGNVSGSYGQPIGVTVSASDPTATGDVSVRRGGAVLASGNLAGGSATLTIPGGALEPGTHTLTVSYAGDAHFKETSSGPFTATVGQLAASVSASDVSVTYGKAVPVPVTVAPAGATGTVSVLDGAKVIGTASVSGGSATVQLAAKAVDPGTTTLSLAYSGDARHVSASSTFQAKVAKAKSTTTAKVRPGTVKARKGRATVTVEVDGADRIVATGTVTVRVPGQGVETLRLRAGKATLKLDRFGPKDVGPVSIRVEYNGSDLLRESSDRVTLRVKR